MGEMNGGLVLLTIFCIAAGVLAIISMLIS